MKNSEDTGKLLLRVTLGGLMLFHGIAKLILGTKGIENMLVSKGIPSFIAYGVHIGEVLAPILIIIGFRTKLAAIIFAFNMLVATLLVHSEDIFKLTEHGGWAIELQALYFFGSICIFLLGAGNYSLSNSNRWD